jgi:hypothetical protein
MLPSAEMQNEISVYAFNGNSGLGAVYSATPTTIKGYVEYGFKKIKTTNKGEEIVSDVMLVLNPGEIIKMEDKIVIENKNYQVLEIQLIKFMSKTHHLEVYLKGIS